VTRAAHARSTGMGPRSCLLPALLVAVALTACGDDEQPASGGQDTTQLTVEVTGISSPVVVDFHCGGGDPCERSKLEKLTAVTEPPDPTRACTEIYGGPEEAHVTGTLEGDPVDVTITRSNGCGIADYEALFKALGREQPLAR
jgi:hypothetical protein